MLESKEKAKDKIAISSNIVYFKLYFDFRWSELHSDLSARYLSLEQGTREKEGSCICAYICERKMEFLKPVPSEKRIKSNFENVVSYSFKKIYPV